MFKGLSSARALLARIALGVVLATGFALPALTQAEAAPANRPRVIINDAQTAGIGHESIGHESIGHESVGHYRTYRHQHFGRRYYNAYRPFYRRCVIRHQRFWTYHGWVYRNVRVCR